MVATSPRAQDMIPEWFANNWLFRLLFGWMIPPSVPFLKFTTTAEFRNLTFTKQVFQDIGPRSAAACRSRPRPGSA